MIIENNGLIKTDAGEIGIKFVATLIKFEVLNIVVDLMTIRDNKNNSNIIRTK